MILYGFLDWFSAEINTLIAWYIYSFKSYLKKTCDEKLVHELKLVLSTEFRASQERLRVAAPRGYWFCCRFSEFCCKIHPSDAFFHSLIVSAVTLTSHGWHFTRVGRGKGQRLHASHHSLPLARQHTASCGNLQIKSACNWRLHRAPHMELWRQGANTAANHFVIYLQLNCCLYIVEFFSNIEQYKKKKKVEITNKGTDLSEFKDIHNILW